MIQYFGYLRVSGKAQGNGTSLQEQRAALMAHADRAGIQISQWFEEIQTAGRAGRPVFTVMIKLLRQRKADGVIHHMRTRVLQESGGFRPSGIAHSPGNRALPGEPNAQA